MAFYYMYTMVLIRDVLIRDVLLYTSHTVAAGRGRFAAGCSLRGDDPARRSSATPAAADIAPQCTAAPIHEHTYVLPVVYAVQRDCTVSREEK